MKIKDEDVRSKYLIFYTCEYNKMLKYISDAVVEED